MNYERLYYQIIQHRKSNPLSGYTEIHHIVPRCIGGSDEESNLVKLSAREHFIAHYLLCKMYPENTSTWHKLTHAFMMMKCTSKNQNRYINSRLYECAKKKFSKIMSANQTGKKNSQFGTRWIYNIELEQSKKISVYDKVPDGWTVGRKINFRKINCMNCGIEFVAKKRERICTDSCRTEYNRLKNPVWQMEEEFIQAYKLHGSMNKALQALGFPGAISHWYTAAKEILDKHQL